MKVQWFILKLRQTQVSLMQQQIFNTYTRSYALAHTHTRMNARIYIHARNSLYIYLYAGKTTMLQQLQVFLNERGYTTKYMTCLQMREEGETFNTIFKTLHGTSFNQVAIGKLCKTMC
jgi:hypothetical protein